MAGFAANPIHAGMDQRVGPPKPPRVSSLSKGIGRVGGPAAFGIDKGISGAGIIGTQPRPPGATPYNLSQAPMPPQSSSSPAAPLGGGGGGSSNGTQLDAQALANIAANQFKVNQQTNALNLRGSQAGTALQSTLGNLAYEQPRAQLGLLQKWNWGGHDIYSTPYDQAQGDLANQFMSKQNAAQLKYSNLMDDLAARIGGLQGDELKFEGQQAAGSAARLAKIAANSPAPPLNNTQAPAGTTPPSVSQSSLLNLARNVAGGGKRGQPKAPLFTQQGRPSPSGVAGARLAFALAGIPYDGGNAGNLVRGGHPGKKGRR